MFGLYFVYIFAVTLNVLLHKAFLPSREHTECKSVTQCIPPLTTFQTYAAISANFRYMPSLLWITKLSTS
jgi:hypothetical protein